MCVYPSAAHMHKMWCLVNKGNWENGRKLCSQRIIYWLKFQWLWRILHVVAPEPDYNLFWAISGPIVIPCRPMCQTYYLWTILTFVFWDCLDWLEAHYVNQTCLKLREICLLLLFRRHDQRCAPPCPALKCINLTNPYPPAFKGQRMLSDSIRGL